MRLRQPTLLLCLALLGCTAAQKNPKSASKPAPWQPPPSAAPKDPRTGSPPPAPAASAKTKEPPLESALQPSDTAVAQTPATSAPTTDSATDAMQTNAAAPSKASSNSSASDCDPTVAMVAGRPVHASELFSQWLYADSLGVLEHLDNLSVGRLVLAEAQRLGVSVSDEQAALTYEKGVEQLEREIQKKRPGITLDKYVDRVLGLDPDRYRERMRDDALRTMLGERVMRSWLLMSEHAHVRVIIVRSEDEAKAAQADLDAGTDFAEVAKKRSVDSSSKAGGSIAPVVKGDTPLGKLAFETEIGKVAGPVSDNGAWLLALVEARPTPLVGTWTQVAPAVEQSLLTAPVDKLEVSQWKAAMLRRYDVDLKPFLKIAGEQAAK